MTDVRIFHEADGGNIEFAGDDTVVSDIKLDTGLESAVYLSWFGGNERSHGHDDNNNSKHHHGPEWWGNIGEPEARHMKSELQHVLRDLPATSNNLLRIEDAAKRDIQWMLDEGLATKVGVTASLLGVDKVGIEAVIVIQGEEFAVAFQTSWGE